MNNNFSGFSPDTYAFLTEIGVINTREFYHANKERYHKFVKEPMTTIGEMLLPDMLAIDPDFNPRMTSILSRIYRDLRFSRDQRPYRDHAWLGFRRDGNMISEGFCIYFEVEPDSVGWGMGMYSANTELMQSVRRRILAHPATFLELAEPLKEGFVCEGQPYKRPHFKDAPPELIPYLDRRSIGWYHSDTRLTRTFDPAFADEVRREINRLGPIYRFLLALD